MTYLSESFILIGAILLSGLAIDYLARMTRLPRVTLLILFGFVIGPSGLDLIFSDVEVWLPVVTNVALLMIGFLLGGQLSRGNLQKYGFQVFCISLVAALMTALAVLFGLLLIGVRLEVALLLAAIATATAPAATVDVVNQMKAKGIFTRALVAIVAIDDAWGLMIFSIMLTFASIYAGDVMSAAQLLAGAWDIAGAFVVGIGLGIPVAFLAGRIRSREATLVEALGAVLLCGGVSIAADVSLLLAVMVMGSTIANLATHHIRPFHEIELIEWPFMILFFVMAGSSLQVDALLQIGFVGIAYIVLRSIGKIAGAWLGAVISNAPNTLRKWTGIAMMPQAGVALGMALIVDQRFPEIGDIVLTVVIGTVVTFEIFGPFLTRLALIKSGEVKERSNHP
ncbi:MAG: cation:proton antiporter [Mariprofundaceae bacterium]